LDTTFRFEWNVIKAGIRFRVSRGETGFFATGEFAGAERIPGFE
jgi:hypothetical protein